MAKHPNYVPKYEKKLEELAFNVGNMSYDQTASFIELLAKDFIRQADSDQEKGRTKLSTQLYLAADKLYEVRKNIVGAWKISEPYMK